METKKRVSELDWSWAVSTVNKAINEQMTAVEKDATLSASQKKLKVHELEKAWQRILSG